MQVGDAEGRVAKRDAASEGRGRNPREHDGGASSGTVTRGDSCPGETTLMEAVVGRENMWQALKRVETNKGAAGVDAMPVTELRPYLREWWPRIRDELLAGRYQPSSVRKVEIPKPGGKGMRQLGIPTVLDRLIQQALNQVL
ncbi:MAG: group II intron reverse transcriptase/maturase, partial [Deltaproteobacteria bacterium]|nr:group II intron reverse transcriptase/maturase [Deltaproteobacteria bacterium]